MPENLFSDAYRQSLVMCKRCVTVLASVIRANKKRVTDNPLSATLVANTRH
jgi:hypothetical protein